MLDDMKRKAIEACAADVLAEDSISSLPVKPIAIAEKRDITVHEKPATDRGVSGMLVKEGDAFAIAYATHISS